MSDRTFSPLDGRYSKDLPQVLSDESALKSQVTVELAYLMTLMDFGLCPKLSQSEVEKIWSGIEQSEIDQIEATTQHATRALVEALARRLEKAGHPKVASWVHVGITSFDTVDTALRLRLKDYVLNDYLPACEKLKATLKDLQNKYKDTQQLGRTHGQWGVPSLFGLMFGEAAQRLATLEAKLKDDVADLRGQASGAVGAYQALGLLVQDPLDFELKFLNRLGLKPHFGSVQILPPEDIVSVAQTIFCMSSVIAKIANDLRHLARSEIGEIAEGLSPGQVGSSTMPQKRNPWNFEHVCSLFKVLQSRLLLLELDLVTEHQRDLTNSASGRFYFEFFSVAQLMVTRLNKVLPRIEVFEKRMAEHLSSAGSSVFAEAFYVLATKHGVEHAHDVVRQASRESESSGKDLLEILIQKGAVPKDLNLAKLQDMVFRGPKKKIEQLGRKESR
jgi:adenylosuccinate lyase